MDWEGVIRKSNAVIRPITLDEGVIRLGKGVIMFYEGVVRFYERVMSLDNKSQLGLVMEYLGLVRA